MPSGTSSPSASPTSTQWPVYSDATYHFSVSYPTGFTFQTEHGDPASGLVQAFRTFDPIYLNTYPPGQIEIAIYARDATTTAEWITKHSAPASSTDPKRYWSPVSNETSVTIAGTSGVSFDWVPDTWTTPVHSTAVLLGTGYVLVLQWWSKDPAYESTLKADYSQMASDLQV